MTQVFAPQDAASSNGAPSIKDFTLPAQRIQFRVDDELFECHPNLPALSFLEFAELASKMSDTDVGDMAIMFEQMWRLFLVEESAIRFLARLRDSQRPITIGQIQSISQWAMEVYGLRPLEQSNSSSATSSTPPSGPNSTVNAPLPASTSATSLSTVSLT
jgi:hypothetical protein